MSFEQNFKNELALVNQAYALLNENKGRPLFHEVHRFSDSASISIQVPGYKHKAGKLDFAVHLVRSNPLSHVNIIVDLYWKVAYRKISPSKLLRWLENIIQNGSISTFDGNYKPIAIDHAYLVRVSVASAGKSYDPLLNARELTFDELAHKIKWIAIQEEINYPRPKFDGRGRPLIVYSEAIASCALNPVITLERSIERANEHSRLTKIAGVEYGKIV
jgi:hypothetical protein